MIIPRIVVPESVHCGMKVSATVPEIAVPEYTECPYELIPLYKEGSSTVSVLVQTSMVAAPRPVLLNDVGYSEGRVPILIDVLANDQIPVGDTYTIVGFTQPTGGVVTLEGTQLLYTPFSYFDGEDSFTYTVTNNLGGKDSARVDLIVTPVYYRYTSASYPLGPVDGLVSSFTVLRGNGIVSPRPMDSITSGLTLLGGTYPLIVRYLANATPPEDFLTSGLTVLTGKYPLIVRYLTTSFSGGNSNPENPDTPEQDALTSGLTILGGTHPITVRYLSNTMQPEHITSSLTILGGT